MERIDDIEFVDSRARHEVPEYGEFQPILDRVLIKSIAPGTKIEGTGLAVPDRYRQHTNKGEVIALGQVVVLGGEKIKMDEFLGIGDNVLYGEYSAERFLKDNDVYWLVRIQDIRGVSRLKRG